MRDALEGKKYVEHYIETLTHEMKSPLSAIRGAAELLNEDLHNMPEAQRGRFLGNILTEAGRIQTLIDRLLELSSLESRKALQVEEVNLAELVRDALEPARTQAERNQVELHADIDPKPTVQGERFLLEQAVSNLLRNALEFTPSGHRIDVHLSQQKDTVVFEVYNSGSSIPDFAADRLFERFYSLARPDTGRRSSGIGLTLVREIADLHGGGITLRNEKNGVAATLTLPLH
jgi:two-component system sensor histidine kinase CreC